LGIYVSEEQAIRNYRPRGLKESPTCPLHSFLRGGIASSDLLTPIRNFICGYSRRRLTVLTKDLGRWYNGPSNYNTTGPKAPAEAGAEEKKHTETPLLPGHLRQSHVSGVEQVTDCTAGIRAVHSNSKRPPNLLRRNPTSTGSTPAIPCFRGGTGN